MKPAPPVTRTRMPRTVTRRHGALRTRRVHRPPLWGRNRRSAAVGGPGGGNHPGGGHRQPALPDHAGGQQAAHARLRQTDGLLPAVHADDGRRPRGAGHHHARRQRGVPGPARRRQPAGHADRLRRPAPPRRAGPGVPHRRGLPGRPGGGAGPRRQHLLRRRPGHRPGPAARARRRARLRLPRGQPDRLRRRGVRRRRPGAVHRGEAGAAQEPLRGARPVLLRQRGRRDRPGHHAQRPRRAGDHRRQRALPAAGPAHRHGARPGHRLAGHRHLRQPAPGHRVRLRGRGAAGAQDRLHRGGRLAAGLALRRRAVRDRRTAGQERLRQLPARPPRQRALTGDPRPGWSSPPSDGLRLHFTGARGGHATVRSSAHISWGGPAAETGPPGPAVPHHEDGSTVSISMQTSTPAEAEATPGPSSGRSGQGARRLEPVLMAAVVAGVVIAGWLRRWSSDDAFINFRVVENILAGNGPVFSAPERVEVATSPAWLLVLTVAEWVVPGDAAAWASVVLGIVGTAAGVILAMLGARRLFGDAPGRLVVPFGMVVFAVLPPTWDFTTSGLETGLSFAWLGLTFWGVTRWAQADEPRAGRPVWLFLAGGLGPPGRPGLPE